MFLIRENNYILRHDIAESVASMKKYWFYGPLADGGTTYL